jgi:hypothetical protein
LFFFCWSQSRHPKNFFFETKKYSYRRRTKDVPVVSEKCEDRQNPQNFVRANVHIFTKQKPKKKKPLCTVLTTVLTISFQTWSISATINLDRPNLFHWVSISKNWLLWIGNSDSTGTKLKNRNVTDVDPQTPVLTVGSTEDVIYGHICSHTSLLHIWSELIDSPSRNLRLRDPIEQFDECSERLLRRFFLFSNVTKTRQKRCKLFLQHRAWTPTAWLVPSSQCWLRNIEEIHFCDGWAVLEVWRRVDIQFGVSLAVIEGNNAPNILVSRYTVQLSDISRWTARPDLRTFSITQRFAPCLTKKFTKSGRWTRTKKIVIKQKNDVYSMRATVVCAGRLGTEAEQWDCEYCKCSTNCKVEHRTTRTSE